MSEILQNSLHRFLKMFCEPFYIKYFITCSLWIPLNALKRKSPRSKLYLNEFMKSFLNFIWIELCSPFVVMTKIYRVRIISVVMLLMYNFFSSSHTFLHHSKNRNIVLKTSFFLHLSSYTFSHACRHVSRIMSVWNG